MVFSELVNTDHACMHVDNMYSVQDHIPICHSELGPDTK